MKWFRHYHALSTDPKLQIIAARTKVPRAFVIALWVHLLEYASEQPDRGSITGFNLEVADYTIEAEEGTAARIIAAMEGRLVRGERIINWDKLQVLDEGGAERVARHRARKRAVTGGNAPSRSVTPRNALSRPERERDSDREGEDSSTCTESLLGKPESESACARKTRASLSLDFTIPKVWKDEARHDRALSGLPDVDIDFVARKFELRHEVRDTRKWRQEFRLWCLREKFAANGSATRRLEPAATLPQPAEPWPNRMQGWRKSRFWRPEWGFRPGEAGCRVPVQFLNPDGEA